MERTTYKVLCFGRDLQSVRQPDGAVTYHASPEMDRRADEVGRFWHARKRAIASIICSSGYPGAAKGMTHPGNVSEAGLQRDRMVQSWNIPAASIQIDTKPIDTFGSFIYPVEEGFIQPGEFNPTHRLVISASTPHSWRIGMLSTAAFQIPYGGVCRLRGGHFEMRRVVRDKERALAIITEQAIKSTTVTPGTAAYVPTVRDCFRDLWNTCWQGDVAAINGAYASWEPPVLPIVAYPA